MRHNYKLYASYFSLKFYICLEIFLVFFQIIFIRHAVYF